MGQNQTILADLAGFKAQIEKIAVEQSKKLADDAVKIATLEAALAAAGVDDPAVSDAVNALKAPLDALDSQIPDEEVKTEEPTV